MSRRSERGAATLLVLTMAGVLVFMAATLGVVGAMVVAHRAAESAADLSALAGAHALAEGRDGCASAADIAADDRARLVACAASGRTIVLRVEVSGPRWLGQHADLAAEARAGPGP